VSDMGKPPILEFDRKFSGISTVMQIILQV
jgi:hypothetical protein